MKSGKAIFFLEITNGSHGDKIYIAHIDMEVPVHSHGEVVYSVLINVTPKEHQEILKFNF